MRPVVLIGCVAACFGSTEPRMPVRPVIANTPGPEPTAPPPDHVSCNDPIAGTWRARVWRAEVGKVDEVTLTIIRVGMTELRGQIVVETWDTADRDAEPALCDNGSPAVSRVVQNATGWMRGAEIDLEGNDPERTAFPCGLEVGGVYNADHFTGELVEGPMLVTTNDDGGTDQGRPHVFKRTACAR